MDQQKTRWAPIALGCTIAAALCLGCLLLMASTLVIASLWRSGPAETADRQDGAQFGRDLDAAATVAVASDGCTVTRTDVTGASPVRQLQWVIVDASGERVLARAVEDEYRYTYYRAGTYTVFLEAWRPGGFVKISNEVKIQCP